MAGPDLNDVDYDAYLANERTLDDPDVIRVERNGEVRLRIINAGASSNFTIDLGNVQGALVAVDGNPITPLAGTRFPVAIAQRADVVLRMPPDGTAVPILALGEGRRLRTGVVLQPPGAAVAKIGASSDAMGPQVGLAQELELRSSAPLAAKAANRSIPVDLTGTMMGYAWGMPINGMAGLPATVDRGERVEIVFRNTTMMSHPMHLHGHVFQVTEVNGKADRGSDPRHHSRAAEGDREGCVRRRQSRAVGVPLPQPLPHGGRHVLDAGLSGVRLDERRRPQPTGIDGTRPGDLVNASVTSRGPIYALPGSHFWGVPNGISRRAAAG